MADETKIYTQAQLDTALFNEREKAAKVIDKEIEALRSLQYASNHARWKIEELPRLAKAIREGR